MKPKCRICFCTDDDACVEGCAWVEPDLCSTCAEAIDYLGGYMNMCGPHTRNLTSALACVARVAAAVEMYPGGIAARDAEQEPLVIIPGDFRNLS